MSTSALLVPTGCSLGKIISCSLGKKKKINPPKTDIPEECGKGKKETRCRLLHFLELKLSFPAQLLRKAVGLGKHHQWSVSSRGTSPQRPLRTLCSCSHPALCTSRNLNYLLGKQTLLFELHKILFLSVPSMELLKTPGHSSAFIQNSQIRAHI